jgi:hypothetical protein
MFTIEENASVETLVSLNKYVHEWHVKAYPNIFRDDSEAEFKNIFKKH